MQDIFDLTNKVAIVTGASSGLGAEFAHALARQGAKLAVVARREDKLQTLKHQIEKQYATEVLPVKCDVLDLDQIKRTVEKIHKHFGKIDILVNNAGVARGIPAHEQHHDDWNIVINTNLSSVYHFAREVGKVMITQRYGRIINTGSIHSQVAMSGFALSGYCAAKHGVLGLTRDLAVEWAKYGVTVNAIAPSYFKSEMTDRFVDSPDFAKVLKTRCPMGRAGKSGELDGALIYFASDASSFTTGQILAIDGGWTAV
jgi:gluconate 5-dehydrogenase